LMAREWFFSVSDETGMVRLGELIGLSLQGGMVLGLSGELGAGKTRFVKGLAKGMGIDPEDVTSPTFTMISEHNGRLPLYHMDFYRFEKNRDASEIGVDEYFEGSGVCAIEWADRLPDILPPDSIRIRITVKAEGIRDVEIGGNLSEQMTLRLNEIQKQGV
jgi:tRNA threonylcarbamoyladenosine biosynthesis protein TsaE